MAVAGFLSTLTSTLMKLNLPHAENSTNFGAHEVAKGRVTYQEEGGVHVFEIHVPSNGSGAAMIALAVTTIIVLGTIIICCAFACKCCRWTAKCFCPCATWCRCKKRAATENKENNDIETGADLFPMPKLVNEENDKNSFPLVPVNKA